MITYGKVLEWCMASERGFIHLLAMGCTVVLDVTRSMTYLGGIFIFSSHGTSSSTSTQPSLSYQTISIPNQQIPPPPHSPQGNVRRTTILTDVRQHGFRVAGLGAHFPGRDGEMVVSASARGGGGGVVGFGFFVGRDTAFLVADVHFVGDEAEGAEDEDWSLN